MKKLICLTLALGFISAVFAQKSQQGSALQSMVDTERAFARLAAEQGTRPAFMAFIADDGVIFRPTAVKGKQWMTEHPLPPSDQRPLLSWYPAIADMARAGDMGYTTGPWEYKADISDAKPVAWGNFLTIWKKQADGSWKFEIDLGISNPQPAEAVAEWQLPNNYKSPAADHPVELKAAAATLLAREREFSSASQASGAKTAFETFAADEVRVYREEKPPFVGKSVALAVLPDSSMSLTWEPAFADVSRSGDLGYTYGTNELTKRSDGPKSPKMPQKLELGNYYRIWKKQGDTWKVVADLLNPLPEPNKN